MEQGFGGQEDRCEKLELVNFSLKYLNFFPPHLCSKRVRSLYAYQFDSESLILIYTSIYFSVNEEDPFYTQATGRFTTLGFFLL